MITEKIREYIKGIKTSFESPELNLKEIGLITLILSCFVIIFLWKVFFLGQAMVSADIINRFEPWASYFGEQNQSLSIHNNVLWDNIMIYYPDAHFLYSNIKNGTIPLWNPSIFCGIPFFLALMRLVSPAYIPFLFLPTPIAYGYAAAIRLLLAGLFMYLFLRTIKVGRFGSLVAAIVFMFNGNTITWLSFPYHLNAELWIPLIFLLFTLTFSKKIYGLAILTGGILGLHFLSGYLQISLYLMLILVLYLVWTFIFEIKETKNLKKSLKLLQLFVIIIIVGLLVGAANIITFKETIETSIRGIQTRAVFFPIEHMITFLIPDFFGNPIDQNYWGFLNYTETCKYVGIIPLILGIIAILFQKESLIKRKHTLFFAGIVFFSFLVAMGPINNILSYIPFFQKGSQIRILVLATFSLSVLAGLGADFLEREVKKHQYKSMIRLIIVFVAISLSFVLGSCVVHQEQLMQYHEIMHYELINILKFIFLLSLGSIILILFLKKKRNKTFLKCLIVLLIILDLFAFGMNYNTTVDPVTVYPKTASVEFLKNDTEIYRVLPIEGKELPEYENVFVPNSLEVYQISDVRGYSTLLPTRYYEYIENFIKGVSIRGNGLTRCHVYQDSKFIDLLNVKYIISAYPINFQGSLITYLSNAQITTPSKKEQYVYKDQLSINRVKKCVIFQHPPSKIKYNLKVSRNASLKFSIGVNPYVWNKRGDGVLFEVYIFNESVVNELFSKYIDPKNNPEDRKWHDFEIDLSSWAEKDISISFVTSPGPSNNTDFDWAVWGDPYIVNESMIENRKIKLVFDKEVYIYENEDCLSRVFVVNKAKIIKNKTEIFKELKSADFNPRKYIILEENFKIERTESLSKETSSAEIISYSPNKVVVKANMTNNGFLVLADAYDPWWEVYIDGKKDKMYIANYILRAVYLKDGKHTIEFIYNPKYFKIFCIISLSTLLISLIIGINTLRKIKK